MLPDWHCARERSAPAGNLNLPMKVRKMAFRKIDPPGRRGKASLTAEQVLPQDSLSVRPRTRRVVSEPADEAPDSPTAAPISTSEYEVGYGKPPRDKRFKPGRSGNPRGRPKDAKGLKTIVRETMTAKVPVRTGGGEKKMSRMEAVLHKTIELGMKGNPRALMQLITLYASAVPEAALPVTAQRTKELSASDLAMLEELKATWITENGENS